MPCPAYNLPATACQVGAVLAKVPGSVCAGCYAMKGNYRWPNVRQAMQKRLESLAHPQWPDAIAFLIAKTKTRFFRWHDSGDLQSMAHLAQIVRVAELLPKVRFWLPTREKKIVSNYAQVFGALPKNLVVRLSAAMVDAAPPSALHTSTVHRKAKPHGRACPAPKQGNKCGECRACWDPRVKNVSYHYH